MALAYLILAHRSPAQVERLFRALYHSEDTFILHFDRRAPRALHELGKRLAADHSNVVVLPSRSVFWGGAIMAEIQIAAMKAALTHQPSWTHFINLTGQDYPLRSRSHIVDFLDSNVNANYISWFDPLQTSHWRFARERIEYHHLEWAWLHRLLAVPGLGRRLRALCGWTNQLPRVPLYRRSWPDFFHYYGGSNHIVLNRCACEYINHNPMARRILRWLRPAAHADEIMFQSVFLNSPLASTVVNHNLRHIEFLNLSDPHPRTLTTNDLPALLASANFYARKFDLDVDSAVLDALDHNLSN
jgi:Core-2/I-Branching enzyme